MCFKSDTLRPTYLCTFVETHSAFVTFRKKTKILKTASKLQSLLYPIFTSLLGMFGYVSGINVSWYLPVATLTAL
jgi:hypothetical protein